MDTIKNRKEFFVKRFQKSEWSHKRKAQRVLHYSEGCFHEATRYFPLLANALDSLNGSATGDNVLDPEIT
jgi:hypothetical protein